MELRLPAAHSTGVDGHVRRVTAPDALAPDGTAIVVGASLAGWRAVETLRAEGFEGMLTLVGAERHLPYDRPPLSKQVLAGTWPPEKAVLADRRRSSELRVHEVLGREAVRLDVEGRAVELDDGSIVQADAVVLATGATPRVLPGTESLGPADGLFTLRTLDDSLALRAAVTAAPQARVVVIGAGFIGAGGGVDLRGPRLPRHRARGAGHPVAPGARSRARPPLRVALRRARRGLEDGVCRWPGVRRASGTGGAGGGKGAGPGSRWSSTAARPWPQTWSSSASASRPRRGGSTDRGSRSATASSVTTGSSRPTASSRRETSPRWEWRHDDGEELIRIEHWQVAAEAGVAAARSLLAGRADAPAFSPVPYFWSDQFGIRFQVLGSPSGEDEVVITEGRSRRGSSSRCSAEPVACAPSWPSASRASSWASDRSCSRGAASTTRWLTPRAEAPPAPGVGGSRNPGRGGSDVRRRNRRRHDRDNERAWIRKAGSNGQRFVTLPPGTVLLAVGQAGCGTPHRGELKGRGRYGIEGSAARGQGWFSSTERAPAGEGARSRDGGAGRRRVRRLRLAGLRRQ